MFDLIIFILKNLPDDKKNLEKKFGIYLIPKAN